MNTKFLLLTVTLITFLLWNNIVSAAVIVDSVQTTPSSCANNGSLKIFAKTTSGSLLYSIISGPVTFPVQTSSTFSSLPPGNYTVEVSNTGNEKQTSLVTINGNYQLPDFIPVVVAPDCPAATTGRITGTPTSGSGLSPFTWELIAPSAVTRPAQSSDVFNNLPQGSYTIRMTDGCNNVQTKPVILFTPPVSMTYIYSIAMITGCDTTSLRIGIDGHNSFLPPYKVDYTIAGVPYSVYNIGEAKLGGAIECIFDIPNATYGTIIDNIVITNNCGTQLPVPQAFISPLTIYPIYTPAPGNNCQAKLRTNIATSLNTATGVGPKLPVTITVKEQPSGNVVETKVYKGIDGNFFTEILQPNKNYSITITDSCNKSYTGSIGTPDIKKYITTSINSQQPIFDSTCISYLYAYGYPTTGTTMTITGGPAAVQSTKPGYAYYEPYVYPKTFVGQVSSDSSILFEMWNTGPGKYYFDVVDSCGNKYSDSFVITTNDVISYHRDYKYSKGCSGTAGLQYDFNTNLGTSLWITDLSTMQWLGSYYSPGVINNLKATDYEMRLEYGIIPGPDRAMNNILMGPYTVKDTIHIIPYQNPSLKSSSTVLCNGNLALVLNADSSKGIPPYQYEIVSGPQTFPPQANNLFNLTQKGVYRIRLSDVCGNSTATDVTVDELIFPPLSKLGSSCINSVAKLTYGASPYFTYTWTKPDGTQYIGDTLIISPVTKADTGIYNISRLATINGCTSTETSSYRLTAGALDSFSVAVCKGQSYAFGTRTLTQTGVYKDTFATAGCDSISILNLTVNDLKKDSSAKSICKGQTFTFGSKTLSQTGIYRDTFPTATCDSISIINLTVNDFKRDSSAVSICTGQTYSFGNRTLNQAGIYRDTFPTATCDSIVVLTLTINNNCVPQGLCSGATHVVWKDDFGAGTAVNGGASTAINPSYRNQNNGVGSGNYSILNYFNGHPGVWHVVPQDHTPNDNGGYFLVMDGAAPDFYTRRIDNLCPNTTYTFSTWTMNMDLPAYPSNPTFIFNVTDISGNTIGQLTTPPTALSQQTTPTWVQNGFTFNTGTNTSVKLNLILTSTGHNDFAFDDIEFSVCGPTLDLTSVVSPCLNKVDLNATLGSGFTNPVYQWYKQNNNNWIPISGATSSTYTDNSATANNWYKVSVKDGASACSFIEDSMQVLINNTPLGTLVTDTTICNGQSVLGHTTSGTYIIDTLLSSGGCDSLQLVLRLSVDNYKKDSVIQSICSGQSYSFGSRMLTQTGIYRDTLTTSTCDSISILNLIVNDFKKDSSTVSICKGQTYPFGNRNLNQTGIYKDTLTTSTCDSISILNLIVNDFKKDSSTVSICKGQTYPFGNRTLNQTGIYRDTLTTLPCGSISILNLTVNNLPVFDIQSDKYAVTKGETIRLTVSPFNFSSYTWSSVNQLSNSSIYNPTSIVNISSLYKVTVKDANNCIDTASLFIQVLSDTIYSCNNTEIYIPTAFTPNADGRNDVFRISGINNIAYQQFHLMIYNRWGNKVFESVNPDKYWDGRYSGQLVETGNYVYYLKFICADGKTFTRKGNIIIAR